MDNRKAIISLSFDDGRLDNYGIAKNLLEPYHIPATFNITTGYIEGEIEVGPCPAMSKGQLMAIAENPLFEIAAHGNMHKNDFEDIVIGRLKLIEWLSMSDDFEIGFASPGSEMGEDYINRYADTLHNLGFSYVRTSLRVSSYSHLRKLSRRIARIIHNKRLFQIAYHDTLQDHIDGKAIVSIPILHDTKFEQVKAIIDIAIREKNGVS